MHRFAALVLSAISAAAAVAADWPAWRGPTGQGISEEKNLPLKWSAKENVKWKIPLAHQGNSTPVIHSGKVFLTQANKGGTERSLFCFDRTDGKELWKKDVTYSEPERNWDPNWYANASPATAGERVVVSFGSAGLFCYDLAGKELWKRTDLGKFEHAFGNSSSPVLHGDHVIQWCAVNEKGRNYLIAVNKSTGKTVWEQDESFGAWNMPVIAKVGGKEQLVISQSRDVKGAPEERTGFLKGLDPATGKEIWHCRGLDSYQYASPLVSNDVAVGMSGYGGSSLAVKLGGTGDITKDRLWLHPKPAGQRVGSGVILGEHIYMVDENAVPHCYELKTGKDLWEGEAKLRGGVTWGSITAADGKLYLLMRSGETNVLAANPKFEVLAVNALDGSQTNSSIAISDGELFIRTFKHLWCISGKK
jgi:outer membrane protein assembly factor BamB